LGDIPDSRWVVLATEMGPVVTLTLLSARPNNLNAYLADLLSAPRRCRDRFATAGATGLRAEKRRCRKFNVVEIGV
jgi:hypothetical protein